MGPIVAETPEAACSLLAKAYEDGGRRLIAPSSNPSVQGILEGAAVRRASCVRMTLGRSADEKPWIMCAILNWAKG